jgi:hypothetical protein
MGGLRRRSALPRFREIPLVLLARVAGRLGRGAVLSPLTEPLEATRLPLAAVAPVMRLILRALSFMAEWSAVRSLRASIVLLSESGLELNMPLGGLFSSMTV